MSLGTALVAALAIIAFAVIKVVQYGTAGQRRRSDAPHDDRVTAQTARELEELRERIQVLERIAHDENSIDARETRRISQEIERLREQQEQVKEDPK